MEKIFFIPLLFLDFTMENYKWLSVKKSIMKSMLKIKILFLKIYMDIWKIENGIIIEMEILDSDFLKARSLKGYANFKKEIEK